MTDADKIRAAWDFDANGPLLMPEPFDAYFVLSILPITLSSALSATGISATPRYALSAVCGGRT